MFIYLYGMKKGSIVVKAKSFVQELFANELSADLVFHSISHTQNVVSACLKIGKMVGLDMENLEIIELAAWFHDTGYTRNIWNHEEESCLIAKDFLVVHTYPIPKVDEICKCIMATKMPQNPETLLQKIICDADLFHLGSTSYFDNNKKLRNELKKCFIKSDCDKDWFLAEIDFISNHKYFLYHVEMELEDQKQANIAELKNILKRLS